ncbi:MAG: hypothetical protein ACOYIB_07455 [Desulfosporosinus sp.]
MPKYHQINLATNLEAPYEKNELGDNSGQYAGVIERGIMPL